MKTLLFASGITGFIICLVLFLLSGANYIGYKTLRDGSNKTYSRMKRRMLVFLLLGVVFAFVASLAILMGFRS